MRQFLALAVVAASTLICGMPPADAGCCYADKQSQLMYWQLGDLPGWQLNDGFDTTGIEAPQDMQEPDWSEWIAQRMGLNPSEVCEVRTRTGKKVDILTAVEAIEVEHVD
ncbi:hypothetical protein GYB59_22070, partial [bacterium]|nr:hypothetical protein [bacterium]